MRNGWRAALAVVLLAGFFVLLPVLVVVSAVLAVFAVRDDWPAGRLVVGCAFFAAVALFTVFRTLIRGLPAEPGLVLSRERAPRLWALIDELAEVAGTRAPDELLLAGDVNAGVTEDGALLGLRRGARRMYVGAPLLIGLTVGELRAVLGHELAHYSERHTRSTATACRGMYAMERAVERVDGSIPGFVLSAWFRLYLLVAMAVSRQQEIAADMIAVQVAGKAVAQCALRRIAALAVLFDRYAEDYLSLSIVAKRTPDVVGGFRAFLATESRRAELNALTTDPAEEETSRFDTHPPLPVRLAHLDRLPDSAAAPDDRPAAVLLDDHDAALAELRERLAEQIDDEDVPLGPPGEWPDIVAESLAATVTRHATMLSARVEANLGVERATLDVLLDLVESGRGMVLLPPMANVGADRDAAVAAALPPAVHAAALATGRARYELDWSGPAALTIDGRSLDVAAAIDDAVAQPVRTAELRERLRDLGIPLDHRQAAAAVPKAGEILGVTGDVAVGRRPHDVVVLGDGILLLRRPLLRNSGSAGRHRRRVAKLASASPESLRTRRQARFVSLDRITHVGTDEGDLGERLVLGLSDGGVLRLQPTTATIDYGGVAALSSLL